MTDEDMKFYDIKECLPEGTIYNLLLKIEVGPMPHLAANKLIIQTLYVDGSYQNGKFYFNYDARPYQMRITHWNDIMNKFYIREATEEEIK